MKRYPIFLSNRGGGGCNSVVRKKQKMQSVNADKLLRNFIETTLEGFYEASMKFV